MPETIQVEMQDGLAVLRLDNGVTNPVSTLMVRELLAALADIRKQAAGLVLCGGGKFFSLGFNLPELLELDRGGMQEYFYGFNQAAFELTTLPLPTVCALEGHAVAGGTILALTCDFRVAAKGRTLLGLNEVPLGVPVPYLTDLTLRQLVGDAAARGLVLKGELKNAEDLLPLGLVDRVVAKEQVEPASLELARELAALPAGAYAEAKDIRLEEIGQRYERNREARHQQFLDLWFHEATQERLRQAAAKF
jgi:enoyl-CoA hydratase/carnithine racemase